MLEMFQYEFMRRAFIVGALLAIILPCIGLTIVLKRLSMIGDTLSHSSLAGLNIGLVAGINPILSSIIFCIIAGFSIEFIRKRLKSYQEISTVIILAASIGIAGLFSSLVKNASSISSYLFGSIVTISDGEFYLILAVSIFVILLYKIMYTRLFLSVFDIRNAKILGINTNFINFLITFLTAVTISLAARTIGSLIVSSLLVIPVICAMQYTKTYKKTLILSIIFSFIFVYAGLIISYFLNLKPGSVIVLLSVICLLISISIKTKRRI